jgi:hypothetical protein
LYEVSGSERLHFLFDRRKSLDTIGTNTSDIIYAQVKPYSGASIHELDAWTAGRPSFYLAVYENGTALDDWLFRYVLKQRSMRLEWVGSGGGAEIYRVTISGSEPKGNRGQG